MTDQEKILSLEKSIGELKAENEEYKLLYRTEQKFRLDREEQLTQKDARIAELEKDAGILLDYAMDWQQKFLSANSLLAEIVEAAEEMVLKFTFPYEFKEKGELPQQIACQKLAQVLTRLKKEQNYETRK